MAHPHLYSRSTEPLLSATAPWEEGGRLSAVSVLPEPDAKRLRLYYLVRWRDDPLRNCLCLAQSADGYTWHKPDLGDDTNIVMRSSGYRCRWGTFMPTRVLYDERAADPARRWKLLYWERLAKDARPGICLATSPDGLAWQPLSARPIITNANDAMSMVAACPDVETPFGPAAFFIYQQTWRYNPHLPRERDNLKAMQRQIAIWTASDFAGSWIGPTTILTPGAEPSPDVQYYWLTPFRREGGCRYGGLLWQHHTHAQTLDLHLATSHDGWTWQLEGHYPLLPLGEPGHFDCGMVMAMGAPVSWQGRAWLFYNGRATVHDGQPRYPLLSQPQPASGIGVAIFDEGLLYG